MGRRTGCRGAPRWRRRADRQHLRARRPAGAGADHDRHAGRWPHRRRGQGQDQGRQGDGGLRAMPATGSGFGTILVVQEVFGVHAHIADMCRRFAKAGYYAIAPELYFRQGDPRTTPTSQADQGHRLQGARCAGHGRPQFDRRLRQGRGQGRHGQARHHRLLLGRPHRVDVRRAQSGGEGGRGLVRPAGAARRRCRRPTRSTSPRTCTARCRAFTAAPTPASARTRSRRCAPRSRPATRRRRSRRSRSIRTRRTPSTPTIARPIARRRRRTAGSSPRLVQGQRRRLIGMIETHSIKTRSGLTFTADVAGPAGGRWSCCCTAFPNRGIAGARRCRSSRRRAIAPSRPTSAAIRRARGPIRPTSPTMPSTSWWPTRSRSPLPRATTASASIWSATTGAGRSRGAWPTRIPSGSPRSPSCRGRIRCRSAARCKEDGDQKHRSRHHAPFLEPETGQC